MRRLTEENKLLRNVKFSPDGNKVSYVRKDNNLYENTKDGWIKIN